MSIPTANIYQRRVRREREALPKTTESSSSSLALVVAAGKEDAIVVDAYFRKEKSASREGRPRTIVVPHRRPRQRNTARFRAGAAPATLLGASAREIVIGDLPPPSPPSRPTACFFAVSEQ